MTTRTLIIILETWGSIFSFFFFLFWTKVGYITMRFSFYRYSVWSLTSYRFSLVKY